MAVDVIVLAAGQGTRMNSALPKVMHRLADKPLLAHVIDTARQLPDVRVNVVVGHGAEQIKNYFADQQDLHWVTQAEQLGTGHAVAQALSLVREDSQVLILYGDVPLVTPGTLRGMIEDPAKRVKLLTVDLPDAAGYGRILRDATRKVTAIVEQKDASAAQLRITEINTGVMCLSSELLRRWIPQLTCKNAQKEYYLTDLVAMANADGVRIATIQPGAPWEVEGVNTRAQLAGLERIYQRQQAERLMAAGVSFADPARFDCRGELNVGRDVFIDINCVLAGRIRLGDRVQVGPNCVLTDVAVGDDTVIKANTVVEGPAKIGSRVQLGPFARVRVGTELADDVRIGNFVETKKAVLGQGSKANHLSYLGDVCIGEKANIGAGTITCNYDGVNKYQTQIGDGAFVGSNASLVAPVKVGANATVGAGSTITKEVPAENLSIARGKQRNIDGWKRPEKD